MNKLPIQALRNDIDYQAIANKHNTTVYVYELENGKEVYCFVAGLKSTNTFDFNNLVHVKRFIKKIKPQTSGHHTLYFFFKALSRAEEFAYEVTEKYVNTHYHIETKQTRRGKLHRVSIINLTDAQKKELTGE